MLPLAPSTFFTRMPKRSATSTHTAPRPWAASASAGPLKAAGAYMIFSSAPCAAAMEAARTTVRRPCADRSLTARIDWMFISFLSAWQSRPQPL
jgi:hypothetical protein